MQCSACGKEFNEDFAYCPWCGSKVATKQEIANFKQIDEEEKLRDLRRNEIWSAVAGSLGTFGSLAFIFLVLIFQEVRPLPALLVGLIVLLFVIGIIGLIWSYQYSRKRQDLVKKLEKGKME